MTLRCRPFLFFFFNDTATTEIYTLSLHDALPIYAEPDREIFRPVRHQQADHLALAQALRQRPARIVVRSEEHTSELQSHLNLVCRLLLEKKNEQHVASGFARSRRRSLETIDAKSD